jgi:hypothetical protein
VFEIERCISLTVTFNAINFVILAPNYFAFFTCLQAIRGTTDASFYLMDGTHRGSLAFIHNDGRAIPFTAAPFVSGSALKAIREAGNKPGQDPRMRQEFQ